MASVGQGGYLSPMAAFAAAQMQHMATINGLPGAPLTPTSGKRVGSQGRGQGRRGRSHGGLGGGDNREEKGWTEGGGDRLRLLVEITVKRK